MRRSGRPGHIADMKTDARLSVEAHPVGHHGSLETSSWRNRISRESASLDDGNIYLAVVNLSIKIREVSSFPLCADREVDRLSE
mgnify:CR=1 FL=1